MTIMIIGYVITVAIACYYVNKFARSARDLDLRLRNYKVWLADSNESCLAYNKDLEGAYRVIDRYEEYLHTYGHFDKEDSVTDAVIEAINDNIACAGIYYDDDGNPLIDQLDWTPQEGVTYSESDDSDV